MQLTNSKDHYGLVAISLHWVMAALILGLLVLGLYMVRLPLNAGKVRLYGLHKEFGILILMLVLFRLSWRAGNLSPDLGKLPTWQRVTARAVHYAFYVFMFLMPITGWLMSSASGISVSFFGWFVLPNFIAPSEDNRILLADIHEWLAYGLIAAICLHVGAALQHHFINKDDILQRMLP